MNTRSLAAFLGIAMASGFSIPSRQCVPQSEEDRQARLKAAEEKRERRKAKRVKAPLTQGGGKV